MPDKPPQSGRSRPGTSGPEAPEGGPSGSGGEHEEFGELLKFTLAGFGGGFALGALLDRLGYQTSAIGQWLVRTLSGEGETLLEGAYAAGRRLRGRGGTLAEAYGWGKLLGLTAPWIIDGVSRLAGVDVYGAAAFYIPYFYAMSDQMGASVAGLLFLRRREKTWAAALRRYFRNPVMIASLSVILAAPAGLLGARLLGFRPSTQVATALETIAANLCWIPPLAGWLAERRERRARAAAGRED
jgi:hypothetical protein